MATLADLYAHLKTLCEQWFYNKSDMDTALSGKANSSHTHGNVSNDGKIGSASGKIITTGTSGALQASDSITKSMISDFPSSMTPSSHTHGNLQNNGQVGSTAQANKNVVTDENGKITTENKPTIPTKTSDLTNDGADGTNVFVANNDSRLSDARTPSSHSHGQVTNDGKITSTAVTVASSDNIVITDASDSSKVKRVANLLASHIKDGTAHANIGSSANDTQATINSNIDTALSGKANSSHTHTASLLGDSEIGLSLDGSNIVDLGLWLQNLETSVDNLSNINAIEIVTTLPSASSSTMGKLYITSVNNKVNVYYTEEDSGTYSWHKMDTDILDELSIEWEDIAQKPSTFTPSSHTHGNISNDGKIGTTASKPLITTSGGVVTTGSFGTTQNTFCEGNDSRLSDARTPTSHTHGQITNDGKITSTAVTVASGDNIVITDASDSSKVKRVANLLTDHIKDGTEYESIGSPANATQSTINFKIDTALSGKAASTHTHGNILNGGTISTDVTFGSKIVVTNSSHVVGTATAIDVLDSVVQSLITYGSS